MTFVEMRAAGGAEAPLPGKCPLPADGELLLKVRGRGGAFRLERSRPLEMEVWSAAQGAFSLILGHAVRSGRFSGDGSSTSRWGAPSKPWGALTLKRRGALTLKPLCPRRPPWRQWVPTSALPRLHPRQSNQADSRQMEGARENECANACRSPSVLKIGRWHAVSRSRADLGRKVPL